jgi:hypothetical protein
MEIDAINLFNFDLPKLNELKDILICPICYDIFDNPVMETINQHVFCYTCLLKSGQFRCPICKIPITQLSKPSVIIKLLESITRTCIFTACTFSGTLTEYNNHIATCPYIAEYNEKVKTEIKPVSEEMLGHLDKEINPHLEEEHSKIFIEIVDKWEWLMYDRRDWKWWWWSSNIWFDGKVCIRCNELWHKYEVPIDVLEKKRQLLVNKLIIR